MSGDQPPRQTSWAPGFPNVIHNDGSQGEKAGHVGNPLYMQLPPFATPGILTMPMNPIDPVERVHLPFNESQSYETRPELFGLGWASTGPSPIKQPVVLPGTNGALDGAHFVVDESGALTKPTANGLVERLEQEKLENPGASVAALQQSRPPDVPASTMNAASALTNEAFQIAPQDISGLMGITQPPQGNVIFNTDPARAQRLSAASNLNAVVPPSLEFPGGTIADNIGLDLAGGQPLAAGNIESAAPRAEQTQPIAGLGFDAAQDWESLLGLNADAVASPNGVGVAGQFDARLPLPYEEFVNAEGAKATAANAGGAHGVDSVHHARQDTLHDNLRVAMAEANASRSMALNAGGDAMPVEAGGRCPRPLGAQASTTDPHSGAIDGSSLFGAPSSQAEEGGRTPSKRQVGPSSGSRKARKVVEGGISKADATGRRREKRKPRTYSQAVPSQHCHICSRRPTANAPHVVCGNLLQSRCRKTICTKCFERFNWDLEAARNAEAGGWTCTHCRGECPARAQCVIYNRTSDRRRMKLINHRKKKGAEVLPVAGSGGGADEGIAAGGAGHAGVVGRPAAVSVGSAAVEAVGSGDVVVGGGVEGRSGVWNGGVGKRVGAGKREGRICKGGRKGGGASKVVVARSRQEFIAQMMAHGGDLQEMARHGRAVGQQCHAEGAALPAEVGGVHGSAEAEGVGSGRWVEAMGGRAEDGSDRKRSGGGDGEGDKGDAMGGADEALEALERLVREAEGGAGGGGGSGGGRVDVGGEGEADGGLLTMITSGGAEDVDEWDLERWMNDAGSGGAQPYRGGGESGGVADQPALDAADDGALDNLFASRAQRTVGRWDDGPPPDVADTGDVAALLRSPLL